MVNHRRTTSSEDGATTERWKTAPSELRLARDEVHIWRIDLDGMSAQATQLRGTLSDEERERSDRFVFENDRIQFTVGHGALREILGRYLGRPASTIEFCYEPHGKPRLSGEKSLSFNLSHSGRYGLLAVSTLAETGVDLEKVRDDADMSLLAERCFSPREQELYREGEAAECAARFFQIWTRKEAYIKAIGAGLSQELTDFECVPVEGGGICRAQGAGVAGGTWTVTDLFPAPGYAGALALPVALPGARFWEWSLASVS